MWTCQFCWEKAGTRFTSKRRTKRPEEKLRPGIRRRDRRKDGLRISINRSVGLELLSLACFSHHSHYGGRQKHIYALLDGSITGALLSLRISSLWETQCGKRSCLSTNWLASTTVDDLILIGAKMNGLGMHGAHMYRTLSCTQREGLWFAQRKGARLDLSRSFEGTDRDYLFVSRRRREGRRRE